MVFWANLGIKNGVWHPGDHPSGFLHISSKCQNSSWKLFIYGLVVLKTYSDIRDARFPEKSGFPDFPSQSKIFPGFVFLTVQCRTMLQMPF